MECSSSAVRTEDRTKTVFIWTEKGGIPIIFFQSRVGGEVCGVTIKEKEGEEGEEEEKWEISANPVVSFSSAPAGQRLSGGGVRKTGDLCRSNTQDSLFQQHPSITHFRRFYLRHCFRSPPPASDPCDGFGNPRPNRRSGAWSLRWKTETREQEKKKEKWK